MYQSYHEVLSEARMLLINWHSFYVFSSRHFQAYLVNQNEEKEFSHQKPMKVLKNRLKMRSKGSRPEKKEKMRVFKIIEGKGGKGDFLALLLEHGEICLLDPELKYIGSYHYLKVHNVVDVVCNDSYQFIAILCDDNSLEVVNIYTQNLLFTVVLPEAEQATLKKGQPRTDSTLSSIADKLKAKSR
jgi:hypothetical protein